MSRLSSRPSTPGSSSSDDDEYTLCAYGDISLSNIYFIPSLPTTVIPRRDDSWMDEKEESKTPPPSVREKPTAKHALPRVIRKIMPPSPSAAELSPEFEFERLVAKFRETRVSDENPPRRPPKPIQSQQVVDRKVQDKTGRKDAPTKRMPFQLSARMNAAKPKRKEQPFRGGRLPVRPPLPRWDLDEPPSGSGACR